MLEFLDEWTTEPLEEVACAVIPSSTKVRAHAFSFLWLFSFFFFAAAERVGASLVCCCGVRVGWCGGRSFCSVMCARHPQQHHGG